MKTERLIKLVEVNLMPDCRNKSDFTLFNEIHKKLNKLRKLEKELEVKDKLLEARQSVLDAIPECEIHGSCIPNAIEWIEKMKSLEKEQPKTSINELIFIVKKLEAQLTYRILGSSYKDKKGIPDKENIPPPPPSKKSKENISDIVMPATMKDEFLTLCGRLDFLRGHPDIPSINAIKSEFNRDVKKFKGKINKLFKI